MKHKAKQRPAQYPTYTFQIEAFSHEGRGIAHYGTHPDHPKEKHGKKVFIRYALVGETVQAKISNQTSRLEEADMVKLESDAAVGRVDPICPHFGVCGGCSLQHIHPDEQILLKQNVLKSHLQHFAGLQPEQWLDPIRSEKIDYRRRARVGVRYIAKQNRLVMGFREHHSNHLTPIQQCHVLDQRLSESLVELRKLLESLTGKAHIGHIELAMGDTETALLIRHLDELNVSDVNQLRQFALLKDWQLYLQPKGADSLHRVDDAQAPMRLHYSLDEFTVTSLLGQGACIDSFGIGERLITAKSEPVFGAVYKLAAVGENGEFVPRIKVSENVEKITNPGLKDLYRVYDKNGHAVADLLAACGKSVDFSKPYRYIDPQKPWKNRTFEDCTLRNLRRLYVRQGKRTEPLPTLDEIRNNVKRQLDEEIWQEEQRFENPHRHYLDMTPAYYELKMELLSKTREEHA